MSTDKLMTARKKWEITIKKNKVIIDRQTDAVNTWTN